MKIIIVFLYAVAIIATADIARANTTESSETLEVWTSPITLINDGKTISTLTVYEKDNVDYTAFNMAIVIPEGVTIARIKQGREEVEDIHLTDRATSSHTITCGMPDPTTIKVISASPSLANYFSTTEDGKEPYALFTIGLIALPNLMPGDYNIRLYDVKFVMESADAYVLSNEPLTFPVSVTDSSVGIDQIEDDQEEGIRYNINGMRLPSNNKEKIYIQNGHKILNTSH